MPMHSAMPNPCQPTYIRSNTSLVDSSSPTLQAPSCNISNHSSAQLTLIIPSSLGGDDHCESGRIGGDHSAVEKGYPGQKSAISNYNQRLDHTIHSSIPISSSCTSACDNICTCNAASHYNTQLSMIHSMQQSKPTPLFISPSSAIFSSSPTSSPSSVSSVSLSGPSSSSLTSVSSFSSAPQFDYSSEQDPQLQDTTIQEEYRIHNNKEPSFLSGLSSDLQCREWNQEKGPKQTENNASEQLLLQSQHQCHLQQYTEKPSHHTDHIDGQILSNRQSPHPPPIDCRGNLARSPAVIITSISSSINTHSSLSSSISSPLPPCSAYSYLSNPSLSPSPPSSKTDVDSNLQYTLPAPSPTLSSEVPRITTTHSINIQTSGLQPLSREQQQQLGSALSLSFSPLPFYGSPSSSGLFSTSITAESTTSTSLYCAYSQPFLSVPSDTPRSSTLRHRTSTTLLQSLESLSPQPQTPSMSRQRSKSSSSALQFLKSPRSSITFLAASDLNISEQTPKTLQDILILAQSHYISHRYAQALALYKLAAEHHHSLPACNSLYALYTSTQTGPGLIRSDTKAVYILIHALRIWMARRWSTSATTRITPNGSMRSRTQDDHDELEEYFAHPRKPSRQQRRSFSTGATASLRVAKAQHPAPDNETIAQSIESEYRRPQYLNWRDENAAEMHKKSDRSKSESENSSKECDDYNEGYGDEDQRDLDTYRDESDNDDNEDEELEREEEARRIGLATSEIEDIIQKICHMIQKGVLGLDEPVLVEAVSMLRRIERGLHQEAKASKIERAKTASLLTSSLSGGSVIGEGATAAESTISSEELLLTQGVDLSFLDLGSGHDKNKPNPLARAQSVDNGIRQRPVRNFTCPMPLAHRGSSTDVLPTVHRTPTNVSIAKLPTKEQETDFTFACAIRIRIMSTLGWVHQKKGEYHYGAQAYGVCSEIPATGKRLLDSLQHQANVQRWTCKAFERKAQEQAEADRKRLVDTMSEDLLDIRAVAHHNAAATLTRIENKKGNDKERVARSPPSRNTIGSSSDSTSSQSSMYRGSRRPDISSPSSLSCSGSESASASTTSGPSTALWGSGIFKFDLGNKSPIVVSAKDISTAPVVIGVCNKEYRK